MTEDQIERTAERRMNALDKRFHKTAMTVAEYDAAVREIDLWVFAQLDAARDASTSSRPNAPRPTLIR